MGEEGRQRRVRVLRGFRRVGAGGVEGKNEPEQVVEHRGAGGLGQFVHVPVVVVERGAAHVGPVSDVGDADLRKIPFPDEAGEGALAVHADLVRGRELWAKIYPICRLLEQHNYAAAVKTGLELTGYPAGSARKPFTLLEGEARAELARLLRAAGVKVVN